MICAPAEISENSPTVKNFVRLRTEIFFRQLERIDGGFAGGKIYACKATVDTFKLTKEDFCPQADKVLHSRRILRNFRRRADHLHLRTWLGLMTRYRGLTPQARIKWRKNACWARVSKCWRSMMAPIRRVNPWFWIGT